MYAPPLLTGDEAFARLHAAKVFHAAARRAYYALISNGGCLTAEEMATHAGVSRPRVIPIMAQLVAAGLVALHKENRPCTGGVIRLVNAYYLTI